MKIDYPKPYIKENSLAFILGGSEDRRHSWIKRALKKGILIRLKRGIYLIDHETDAALDNFEIASQLYGPSYISFESALSYHGWIPEAVHITTSASTKRKNIIQTPIGTFSYEHTPVDQFHMGVERVVTSDSIYLIAQPWKALADYVFVRHRVWPTLLDAIEDLRLDDVSIKASDRSALEEISIYYDSPRVRRFARTMLEDLKKWT